MAEKNFEVGKALQTEEGALEHPFRQIDMNSCQYVDYLYSDGSTWNGNARFLQFADVGSGYYYPRTNTSTGIRFDTSQQRLELDLDNQSIKYDVCNSGLHVPFDGTTIGYDACTGYVSVIGGGGGGVSHPMTYTDSCGYTIRAAYLDAGTTYGERGNLRGFRFADVGDGYFYPRVNSSTGINWSQIAGLYLDLDNQSIKFDACNGGLRVPFDGTTIGYDACTGQVSVIGGGSSVSHPMTYSDMCGRTITALYADSSTYADNGNLRGFRYSDFGSGYWYPRTNSSTGVTWSNTQGIGLDLDNQTIKFDACNGGLRVPFDNTTIGYNVCSGVVEVLGGGGGGSSLGVSYTSYNTEYYLLGHSQVCSTSSVTAVTWSDSFYVGGRADYSDTYIRVKHRASDMYLTDAIFRSGTINMVQYRPTGGNSFYVNVNNDVTCNYYQSRISFDHSCHCYSWQFHVYGNGSVRSGTHEPVSNGLGSLGTSCNKWSVVYAQTGSINTSDERVKDNIRSLNDAEVATALACKDLIRIYQFTDAIEAKGVDGARLHVGVMAQALRQAFADNGLDASDYGMFCYDKNWSWTEWHCEYEVEVQNRDQEGNLMVDDNGDPVMVTQTEIEVVYAEPADDHSYTKVTPIPRHEKWSDPKADGIPDTADVNDAYAVRYDELAMFIIGAIS